MLPQTVHNAEKFALVEEGVLFDHVLPYAAVVDLNTVLETPSTLRLQHPCQLRPLSKVSDQKAVVQHCPTLGYRFLWCHVNNNRYRTHYIRFLQQEHAWGTSKLPRAWHVDHVFNRKRAKDLQLNWVRMMLLPDAINWSHGGGYEKQRTRSRITGREGRDRLIDEVTLAKVSGVKSPLQGKPASPQLQAYAQWIAQKHGLSTQAVIDNLSALLAV